MPTLLMQTMHQGRSSAGRSFDWHLDGSHDEPGHLLWATYGGSFKGDQAGTWRGGMASPKTRS